MRKSTFGRATIALLCLGPVVDVYLTLFVISDSHLGDPTWPVHAQLHQIWALITPVIVGLAALYLVLQHWQRLPSTVRATICVIVASWYLGEAIAYFVFTPLYFDSDPVPHEKNYVLFPFLKTVLIVQALLALAVALAYFFDRKHNPAPVSSAKESGGVRA